MGLQHIAPTLEADQHKAVVEATWGHLAASEGAEYQGRIVYAVGIYGDDYLNPTALVSEFDDLANSPWEYEAVQAFLQHEDTPKDAGCIYEFVGVMRNYECSGVVTKVLDTAILPKPPQQKKARGIKMSDRCKACDEKRRQTTWVLEDLQDRAARAGMPAEYGGLVQFTDFIRSLYPEYYGTVATTDKES